MKILQVITSLEQGGAEVIVVNLATRLRRMGHEVDVCVFNGKETPLMKQLRSNVPEAKIYKLGMGYYQPCYVFKLAKLMRGYDIVHTHNSSPQLFVAIAGLTNHVKLVTTEHNTSNRKRQWKWYRFIESWMYRRYDHIICISKVAEDKLREYMGGDWLNQKTAVYHRMTTINNGVDVETIHQARPASDLIELKQGRKAILMVAAFRKQKDQDTLVKAMTLLDKSKFEVWFAGTGERLDSVRQLAVSLGVEKNIRFLGLRTDVPQVLKAADMIVMSSHWEGLSLSNVEGMSAGKPFIASNVNGLKEVTEGYGILFPHEDAGALAKEIMHLGQEATYSDQIARRCYERALAFDINKMMNAYEKVYQNSFDSKQPTI